jgi:hypothetical protein
MFVVAGVPFWFGLTGRMTAMSVDQTELAHWYYTPEEWDRYINGEWERFSKRFVRSGIVLAAVALAFLVFVGIASFMSSGLVAAVAGVLLLGTPIAIVLGGLAFINYHAEQNRCKVMRSLPPEIVVTTRFLVFGGGDYLKTNMYKALTGQQAVWMRIEGGTPPTLRIDVTEWMSRWVADKFLLPIPPGHENEARKVVEHFSWRNRAARTG